MITLDKLSIKLCENLPWDFTIYEKDGFCKEPGKDCIHCRKISGDIYSCNKKTYTFHRRLKLA